MAMVCGAETTREDDFIYSQEVSARIEKALRDLQAAQEGSITPGQLIGRRRAVLESLAWFAYRKGEE